MTESGPPARSRRASGSATEGERAGGPLAAARRATLLMLLLAPAALGAPDGATLFTQNCSPCHGKDGSGNTPVGKSMKAKDLRSAEVQKLTDAEITKIISDGKGNMPSFKSRFKPGDIAELVKHIRSIAKK